MKILSNISAVIIILFGIGAFIHLKPVGFYSALTILIVAIIATVVIIFKTNIKE